MTIKLQLGHTYRTRDGSAEHTIDRIDDIEGEIAYAGKNSWWVFNGQKHNGPYTNPMDLVEEVTPGPVRQTTVTRTEIVPGIYGNLQVASALDQNYVCVMVFRELFNAEELDQAVATLTQLAAALRAIAAEKGTDQ